MSSTKNKSLIQLTLFEDEDRLKSYNEEIKEKFKSEMSGEKFDIFTFDETIKVVKGSNAYANKLLVGNSLPSLAEIMQDIMNNQEKYKEFHVDLGLTLRTDWDSYPHRNEITRDLFKQAKHKGFIATPEEPIMIPYKALSIIEDKDFWYGYGHTDYGLKYKLTDETEIIQAHEFGHKNYGRKFLEVDERGVPKYLTDKQIEELSQDKISKLKTFYPNEKGLGRLSSNLNLIHDTGLEGLGYLTKSYNNGRIFVKI